MLCKTLGFIFLFLSIGYGVEAHAYINAPVLLPSHPKAGDFLQIEVRAGVCDGFPGAEDSAEVQRVGGEIHMLIPSIHDEADWCTLPLEIVYHFWIGSVPAGVYNLKVDRHYTPIFGQEVVETIGTTSFAVLSGASSATSVPSAGFGTLVFLALILTSLGVTWLRYRIPFFLVISLAVVHIFPMPANAQPVGGKYVEVLVTTDIAAPTATQIVNYDFSSVGPPPLQGLAVEKPQQAYYLLPRRAAGDFLAYVNANPQSARAKLERYVVIRYPLNADIAVAISSLRADPYVLAAAEPLDMNFSAQAVPILAPRKSPNTLSDGSQYGRADLNIDAAWALSGGYVLVGDIDSGLATTHPSLRQFSTTGEYLGGNFIPEASVDIGKWPDLPDTNVDEAEPFSALGPCDPDLDGWATATFAGHGTHVSGLIAANGTAGPGMSGTCEHCGIAQFKVTYNYCLLQSPIVYNSTNAKALPEALTILADTGAQVVNMSFGRSDGPTDYCGANSNEATCVALTYASERGIAITAASGNERTRLQFPARDSRTIAVGGFDQNLALWDESPGNFSNCPAPGQSKECGSNYTTDTLEAKQELVASAKSVLSTTYPGKDWNLFGCGDSFGTAPGDGRGLCTGTSMSAPQVAGIVGLLRSINPLVLPSHPIPEAGETAGLRTVLAQTTFEAQAGKAWTPAFGFGRPDAAAAAKRMLGEVAGKTVKNRVTPLFRFHSSLANDYLDTTSPQLAIAALVNQVGAYSSQGAVVPGYESFPGGFLATPKASVYVMTTEFQPRPEWPALLPLHMVERSRNYPAGCLSGTQGCNDKNRDFALLTTKQEIETAHTEGFSLRTIQGYIYQPCSPEPSCIPPGAQKFYRACKTVDDDCATFLESERNSFEAAGYVTAYPAGSKLLGYAYPAIDSDEDGLIDGFEFVVGTDPLNPDSDADGASDGVEFPMTQLALSDPCTGLIASKCSNNVIFRNGFQATL